MFLSSYCVFSIVIFISVANATKYQRLESVTHNKDKHNYQRRLTDTSTSPPPTKQYNKLTTLSNSNSITQTIEQTVSTTPIPIASATDNDTNSQSLFNYGNDTWRSQLNGLLDQVKQAVKEKPYLYRVVLPMTAGMVGAVLTVCLICTIRCCVKRSARQRRKRRIKNLAQELKSDRTLLLAESSDDEF